MIFVVVILQSFSSVYANSCLDYITPKAILRRNYQDVMQTTNGGILITARNNMFIVPQVDNSPLRNSIYFPYHGQVGHVAVPLHGIITLEFIQSYLINRIRFWMYDYDLRVTHMQVFAVDDDGITETLIYQGSVPPGVKMVQFPELLVKKLKFYNKDGNTLYEHMSIIKAQAYYAI
ncbi:unnamed protein product [Paramecium pentaurelia]|uniref:Uncharacterized protein n=1 Tax=Paramecium pentaurelia TaxID=43138 RepID=A0A8S1XBQ7_9CILI|nr:unnamed protein product [Paramecium pentaurelia]